MNSALLFKKTPLEIWIDTTNKHLPSYKKEVAIDTSAVRKKCPVLFLGFEK
jgi:hypothetical protein